MKQRVLVVDDNRLVADTLSLIFQANGFESEVAYSAAEGMERARTFSPRLLLCDVSMPGETGLDLVARMDREMPECRLLMLSAYSSSAAVVELSSRGMKRPLKLLNKPCRPEELLREATALLMSA
jgi:DNA-binding response OmpR family regulator